ncbi:pyridoxamine 5'-phosphate oxidase family protein [Knoellia koreensis]|uniref:Pyridoxamine 5'-phosphate oxidase family protein n=1 Tax=Knoellia koreensis TaxID=2730921 RepID=A0A849HBY9_9MICO|nr:pyridoxamine 5'-phosphate oxidase family protein [Knoellia sp. DB2414S]NNM47390.1 pyridoxamine 5'-phosphate oxidase family protein [Knoellia sp. DB2414S]
MTGEPTTEFDTRYSEAQAEAPQWPAVRQLLADAELYWLTTIRDGSSPHVTPLVGIWHEDGFAFCTGPREQKARNLADNPDVAVTTGSNTWADGHDVVVEGTVTRIQGGDNLRAVAEAYRVKYGSDWDFEVDEEHFNPDNPALVFWVRPRTVRSFTKSPHGQTAYRFE